MKLPFLACNLSKPHPLLAIYSARLKMKCVVLFLCLAVTLDTALSKNIKNATLTLLHEEAKTMGAVCLDGSPPGYYLRPGSGKGSDKWILHLLGGGWCNSTSECYNRSYTDLGSSKRWPLTHSLNGFLSDEPEVNPDFHDWNIVLLMYCDGASFAGDREAPDHYLGVQIYYRGYRILKAILGHLNKGRGMEDASEVILTGCSAGGLAVYLHADYVKTVISPQVTKYRAFPDAGYFLDIRNIQSHVPVSQGAGDILRLQNVDEALIPACKRDYAGSNELWKCFFAPYIYHYIKTPLFVLNSQYDTAQLNGLFGLPCLPPNCTQEQMKEFEYFRMAFNTQVKPVLASSNGGYFLDSCLIHCQTFTDEPWTQYSALGHPLRQSFADWYYERPTTEGATRVQDCNWPCNPSCPARRYTGAQEMIFPG